MDRIRSFPESMLSIDEKTTIRVLVSKKVLDPRVWTTESITDEELLQTCKRAVLETKGKNDY